MSNETLPYLSSEERLKAYQLIIDGCHHIWSKNKLNQTKVLEALNTLIPLAKNDPYFLAHLTSWAIKNDKHKDLKVLSTFVSSLSSADGQPFSVGSKYKKPNLRYVAAAASHQLDPKLAERILQLAQIKFAVPGHLNNARHFTSALRTALVKYLRFREQNAEGMEKLFNAGFAPTVRKMFRALRLSRDEANAKALKWQLKGEKVKFGKSTFAEFKDLDDLAIAEKIRKENLPFLPSIRALPRKMSPVVAVALLEQASGDQAVICRKTFEDAGVLADEEVKKMFEEKIATAKTALDRVEALTKTASEEVKKAMLTARAEKRKETTGDIGKVYLHIDFSPSMDTVRKFAVEKGAIFAECVKDPRENFRWGIFSSQGEELELPDEFVQEAFAAKLFGKIESNGTNAFALYERARNFGADVDVIVTDREHNFGILSEHIKKYHEKYPDVAKPRACVIIDFSRGNVRADGYGCSQDVKDGYELAGIPVALLKPDTLAGSAMVAEAVRNALLGPIAVIDEIMDTELLKLPDYYFTIHAR